MEVAITAAQRSLPVERMISAELLGLPEHFVFPCGQIAGNYYPHEMPQPPTRLPPPVLDASTTTGIDRYVSENGLLALFDYLRARYPEERNSRAGRSEVNDVERLARFIHHLADPDLVALLERAGRTDRAPTQRFADARHAVRTAARHAIRDCPQLAGDIVDGGSIRRAAIDRLLGKVAFEFDGPPAFDIGMWT